MFWVVHYLKNILTSMELRFWNQAAVVSTAEIFTLSACTTAGDWGCHIAILGGQDDEEDESNWIIFGGIRETK